MSLEAHRAGELADQPPPGASEPGEVDDLLYTAWGLLCNVSNGDWTQQGDEWRLAVLKYRDQYHDWLNRTLRDGAT